MSSPDRQVPLGRQRKLATDAWRQRGFVAARYGRDRFLDEELLELAGEIGRKAYLEGKRTGERERRREEGAAP